MADTDFTDEKPVEEIHKPHKWHRKEIEAANLSGDVVAGILNTVFDTSSGIASLSSLIAENAARMAAQDSDQAPYFNVTSQDSLLRLITVSSTSLAERTSDFLDWVYSYRTEQGIKERLGKEADSEN
jgi:hypothetical protein